MKLTQLQSHRTGQIMTLCLIIGCTNLGTDREYCTDHICRVLTCTEVGATICTEHACEVRGCLLFRLPGGATCIRHSCKAGVCRALSVHNGMCDKHACQHKPDCKREGTAGICPIHAYGACKGTKLCSRHCCVKCNAEKNDDYMYCRKHKCTEHGCINAGQKRWQPCGRCCILPPKVTARLPLPVE